MQDIKKNDYSLMDILHHLTSGAKAHVTQFSLENMYVIIRAIGGGGYSIWTVSGIFADDGNPCVTFEGDNTVMF